MKIVLDNLCTDEGKALVHTQDVLQARMDRKVHGQDWVFDCDDYAYAVLTDEPGLEEKLMAEYGPTNVDHSGYLPPDIISVIDAQPEPEELEESSLAVIGPCGADFGVVADHEDETVSDEDLFPLHF